MMTPHLVIKTGFIENVGDLRSDFISRRDVLQHCQLVKTHLLKKYSISKDAHTVISDIRDFDVPDIDTCKTNCEATDACVGFVVDDCNPKAIHCWLKYPALDRGM